MDSYDPADDNKYAIGLAAFLCLLPLPIIFFALLPIIPNLPARWTPWILALLLLATPPLTAFTILYHGPWRGDWPRSKRILLGIPLSLMIATCDVTLILVFIFPFSGVCYLAFPDLFVSTPPSRGQY
ncbi:MAG TPA: hypothetical protein VMH87_14645 [Pseudomonadales bacterium]|nr:hypothetical protein [Pseudomonadales bacterium]